MTLSQLMEIDYQTIYTTISTAGSVQQERMCKSEANNAEQSEVVRHQGCYGHATVQTLSYHLHV